MTDNSGGSGGGCLGLILSLIISVSAFVFIGGRSSITRSTPPPRTDLALIVEVAPAVDNFSADDLVAASTILDTRLETLGLLAQPSITGGSTITLFLTDELDAGVLSVGFLEFVDFAEIDDPVVYADGAISTDAQLENFGGALQPDATRHPVTLDLFETGHHERGYCLSRCVRVRFRMDCRV